ncbi:hypothetical protein EDD85DRAFT_788042 [Armillaria nabsnona]|nr:hypothetical protein EDD85DRAFT_788042 [Armillaria nabsnona]
MKTDSINDDYAQWIPGSDKYEVLEDYLECDVMLGTLFIDPSGEKNSARSKRKGYDSSREIFWRRQFAELFWGMALANPLVASALNDFAAVAEDEEYITELFHCKTCGEFTECKECCIH